MSHFLLTGKKMEESSGEAIEEDPLFQKNVHTHTHTHTHTKQ